MEQQGAFSVSKNRNGSKWYWLRYVAVLPMAWIIGLLLLWGVYSLPEDLPFRHAQESAHIFWTEKTNQTWIEGGLPNVQQDNITDARIIAIAANTLDVGYSALERALNQYMPKIPGQDYSSCTHLAVYLSDPEQPVDVYYYGRYWGGFALMARLWLFVCNYPQIRTANLVLQILVAAAAVWIVHRELGWRGSVAVLIAYIALSPYTISRSMQYYPCFYLSFGGMIAVCLLHRKNRKRYDWLFLVLGILTAYLDFLTYPAAVVGLPLMIWLALNPSEEHPVLQMFRFGIIWSFGYVGMWAGKWLLCGIAGLSYSGNPVSEKLLAYTGGDSASVWKVFVNPFLAISKKRTLILGLPSLLATVFALKAILRKQKAWNSRAWCFGLLMLVPLAWIYLTKGHSLPHSFLSNRNLSVFFASAFLLCSSLAKPAGRTSIQ